MIKLNKVISERMGFWLVTISSGLIFFYLLKYHVEPWVIEVFCKELFKCVA